MGVSASLFTGEREMANKPQDSGTAKSNIKSGEQPKSRRELIYGLLQGLEERLQSEPGKVSLGDYIRLLQLEREMEAEEPPKEIIVRWVDQPEESGK